MERRTLTIEELDAMADLATLRLILTDPSLAEQPELLAAMASGAILSYCIENGYDLPLDEMANKVAEAEAESGDIEINIVD